MNKINNKENKKTKEEMNSCILKYKIKSARKKKCTQKKERKRKRTKDSHDIATSRICIERKRHAK
jgi:hypothetical protein